MSARALTSGSRRFVPTVLALYAACRLVTTGILWLAARRQVPSGMTGGDGVPVTFWSFTALWDGQWYQRIAEGGYPAALPVTGSGKVGENAWAFYPLFPLTVRALMSATGASFAVAASLLALALGFGAAVLMGLLLRDRVGDPAAYVVVVLFASFPASVALQLAYTESLAMLLLVAFLHALGRERWLLAASVALLLGLARPIAVPLAVVALVGVLLRWRRRASRPLARRESAAMLAMLAACGLAGVLWPAVAWWGTGSPTAYTDTMAAWRAYDTVQLFVPWLDKARWLLGETWGPVALVALPAVLVVMVAGPWARALGAGLRSWSLAYPAYLAAVLDPFTSIFRYLIPLFPLLVVLVGAGWADGRRRTWRWLLVRGGPLLVLFVAGQWWWTDALWRFVPPSDYPP